MSNIKNIRVGPTYNGEKQRWFNAYGHMLIPGKGYYSKNANKYVMYGTDGSVTKFTPEQYIKKKNQDTITRRKQNERKWTIPVDKSTEIKLTNTGETVGLKVNTNVLDTIAKYGKQAGISLRDALGLWNQESSASTHSDRKPGRFYKERRKDGRWNPEDLNNNKISPVVMVSNWSYINNNPYQEYLNATELITDKQLMKERKARKNSKIDKYAIGKINFERSEKKFNVNEHPLLHAFKLYKSGLYNTGDKNHTQDVERKGDSMLRSPEIQNWIKNSNYAYD